MANLPENATFDAGVYQLEITDPVAGGVNGASNTPLKNLANRTLYLKQHVDAIEAGTTDLPGYAKINSPAFTGSPTAPTQALGDDTTNIATTAFVQGTVKGRLAKDVAGTGSVSLTAVEAGYGMITFTGTLTGARTVIVPSKAGWWIIGNATAGAFTLTVKTAAGSGVNVSQGARSILLCNGTDVLLAQSDFDSIAMTGNPTAPTQASGDNSTRVATTAFVKAQGYLTAAPVTSVAGRTGAVTLTSVDVGLGNANNTSDAAKPVSTAQQAALDLKLNKPLMGLAGAVDFNTLTTEGFAGVVEAGAANAPGGGTGYWYVLVFKYSALGSVTQVAFPYGLSGNSGVIAYRTLYQGVWQAWKTLSVDGHTHTKANVTDFTVTLSTEDLNNVVTSGFYRLGGGNANLPSAGCAFGQMIVSRGADTILQIVGSYASSEMYRRSGNPAIIGGGGGWTGWTRLDVGDWNTLLNKPGSFTPAAHQHNASDITPGWFPAGTFAFSGRIQISEVGGYSSWIEMFDEESPNGKKFLHANGNQIGFVNGGGSWVFYSRENGEFWSSYFQTSVDGNFYTPMFGWMSNYLNGKSNVGHTHSEYMSSAGISTYGGVGSLVFAMRYTGAAGATIVEGTNYAGSELYPAGLSGATANPGVDTAVGTNVTRGGTALTGTWRALGRSNYAPSAQETRCSLFVRVS